MGDLLKDLARTRPATPEVDPDRMERDLARITSLPRRREWAGAPSFTRRFGPVLVAFAAVVLLTLAVLPSDRAPQFAVPSSWWHVQTRHVELMMAGDPANPYVMRLASDTDEWFAPGRHVKVSQLSGAVTPNSETDATKWQAAGSPAEVPLVGMNHLLRTGLMRPGAWQDDSPVFAGIPFSELEKLPADAERLRKVVGSADLAMRLALAPLRTDQRQALLSLLTSSPGATSRVTELAIGTTVMVGVPGESPQFGPVENQLFVDKDTGVPTRFTQYLKTPRYGLPEGTAVRSEEYLHLGTTDGAAGPPDVKAIGEVESPIVDR